MQVSDRRSQPTPTRHWLSVHTASLRRAGGVLAGHDEGNDETVQTQSLGENEDEDHSDEKPRLLSGGAHTSVTNNANSHTGGEAGETAGETTSKMSEAVVEGVGAGTGGDCKITTSLGTISTSLDIT